MAIHLLNGQTAYSLKTAVLPFRWPFIFNDLKWDGYKTAYSEDDPGMGAFWYRVSGFKKQPTDKYISPWFKENSPHSSTDCTTKYTLDYIKDFLTTHNDQKKFVLGIISRYSSMDLHK